MIVLQMYCYYKCSVALPHGAVGWYAVCYCGIFLIILNYVLIEFYMVTIADDRLSQYAALIL